MEKGKIIVMQNNCINNQNDIQQITHIFYNKLNFEFDIRILIN